MNDIYDPFDGVAKFKKFCETLDTPVSDKPTPRYEGIPNERPLYDIYKRTTDLTINKCIGIGFTLEDAERFIGKRLKVKWNDERATFYEIIPQSNSDAINPLWNPKEIVIEDAN